MLPPGYKLVAPGIGLPDPDAGYQPSPPWTPKEPVDIRDVIHVPAGLAPWGYIEYFPGWFTPGPALTNTPVVVARSTAAAQCRFSFSSAMSCGCHI